MQDLLDAGCDVQLDEYTDFFNVMLSGMPPELWRQYRSFDGHYYQVLEVEPGHGDIHTRMLREAGVISLRHYLSEFLAAAARVTRDRNGDGRIDQWMATIIIPICRNGYRLLSPLPGRDNGQKFSITVESVRQ